MSDDYKHRTSLKRNKQLLQEINSGSRRNLQSLTCTKTPPSVSSSAAQSATGPRALSGADLVGSTNQHQSARSGCKKGGLGRALQAKILQHCTEAARPHVPLALLEMCPRAREQRRLQVSWTHRSTEASTSLRHSPKSARFENLHLQVASQQSNKRVGEKGELLLEKNSERSTRESGMERDGRKAGRGPANRRATPQDQGRKVGGARKER